MTRRSTAPLRLSYYYLGIKHYCCDGSVCRFFFRFFSPFSITPPQVQIRMHHLCGRPCRPCIPRGDRSDAPSTRTSTADGHSTTMAGRGGGERKDLGRTNGGFSRLWYIILCYNNTPSRIALNGFVWCIHNWTDFREFFTWDLCELINITVRLLHACVHI